MAKNPKKFKFGRLFQDLPAFTPSSASLLELGKLNGLMFDPNADEDDNPDKDPSGFTYFGQFVDHDMTLDKQPLADSPIDVNELENFREPNLNLDSLYGGGPDVNPELYDNDCKFILSSDGLDLQRDVDGKAILVESRNDENMIIAQFHVAFCRFHNALIDLGYDFDKARKLTTLHYQWLIVYQFLPKFVGQDAVDGAMDDQINIYNPGNPNKMIMPVEFSVAAYRFGHSMVRRAYFTSNRITRTQVFNENGNDLRGGRPIPIDKIIDWSNFFEIPGKEFPSNISRKIDPLLSSGLFVLPPISIPGGIKLLAQRNLIRGKSYGLPSGQAVAVKLGIDPLTNVHLGLDVPEFESFNGESPLWYYILKEAQLASNGSKLGPVGSKIVADVIVGLIKKGKEGLFHGKNKKFVPFTGTNFNFADFLKIAGLVNF